MPGRVGAYSEGRAVKALANGQARAVNEQGKRRPGLDELWQRRGLGGGAWTSTTAVDGQGKLAIPTYARASTFQDQRAVASTDAASLLIDTRATCWPRLAGAACAPCAMRAASACGR